MTQAEMKQQFEELYNIMATSNNPRYMRIFGDVMKKMMEWLINNKQELAKEYLDDLCAILWNNYLTDKDVSIILTKMDPRPIWSKEEWKQAMDSLDIVVEEAPYYNCNALFVAVSMIYSDSANTIAKLLGKELSEVSTEEMAEATHMLAIDKLKDKDKVFNIRSYFGV